MTNSIAKRALTVAVVAATIIWSVGFAALVPQKASAATYGDLIKGTTLSTVYYYGSDGQRYSFPNEKTFLSWYGDFSGVKTISDSELANITLAGNIAYRPGSRWIKITSDNKTYAVAKNGSIRWIESEAVATGLAGADWNQFIDDVPDVFFVDYTVGDSLTSAASAYEGALVKVGSDNYLVWGGNKLKVTSAGLTANGYKSGFVLDGTGATLAGLTAGSDVTTKLAYLTDAAQKVTTTAYETAKDVSVNISGSPAASTIIAGQAVGDLVHVNLTNNSGSEVKLTSITLRRTGVSADTTLANVYLFNGFLRLTDAATVSDGKVTFNNTGGIVTLAAGASTTLTVRADITASTNGQTVGLKLASASDLSFSNSGSASGSFPFDGAVHTIASSPSTFGAADFTGSTTPSTASIDPQEGYRVFERTLSVSTNELNLQAVRFRNIGSIDAKDVSNWALYVGGVKRGSTVTQEDADGYITFDLSAAPVELKTGNHQVKVLADIIGGSGRTVTVGLRNSADFVAVDQDYGQPVKATVSAATFAAMDAGVQTINSGSITFTKTSDSPAGNVTDAASNVTLGRWTVKAYGENIKVESLRFYVDDSTDATAYTLRNGAVYLNGVQVGSTASLAGLSDSTAAYTEYTFGSAFIVEPGKPATLELKADLVDNDGTDQVADTNTLIANIDNSSSNNVLQVTSGGYLSRPSSDTAGNQLTIAVGSLTVASNGSYANQTVVVPKTGYKVGSWTVAAGTTEDVNLTSFEVDFETGDDGGVAVATDDYTNLYIEYGPVGSMTTSSVKGTVTTANNWAINYVLKKGETIYVNAYADVASGASDGTDAADFIIAELDGSGTSTLSSTSVSDSDNDGQTIYYYNAGSFTEFNDDHPVAANTAANKEVTVAKYRMTAANESYTIKELTTSVASATAAGLVNQVRLYEGSTLLGSEVYDENTNTRATFTGLGISVPLNTSKILTVKYLLNDVGYGAGTSQTDVANTLYSVKFADSQGVESTETSGSEFSSINGNTQYVFKSVPTISAVDLTNSTLVNGQASDLYKFTVTADANGAIALKQFKLTVAWSDGGTGDTLEVESFKLYKNGSDITSSTTVVDELGNVVSDTTGIVDATPSTRVIFTWSTEDSISAGETVTYTVRGTPTGFRATGADTVGDSVSLYLAQDASTNSTSVYLNDETDQGAGQSEIMELFTSAAANTSDGTAAELIWSDISSSAHTSAANTSSTGDWHNGYLVKNLDLAGETWTK